jgi:hypothetical protein
MHEYRQAGPHFINRSNSSYSDDIGIIAGSAAALKEAFLLLERAATGLKDKWGKKVSEHKCEPKST